MESEGATVSQSPTEVGAQAVLRACDLMTAVARSGERGARLVDLASMLGLSRPTAHRIVQALVSRQFLQQRDDSRYRLGAMLFEMGLQAPGPLARLDELIPPLHALARLTGDTCYLMMRCGDEVLCLARAEGAFPIQANVIAVGVRRPLTTGIGGLAILAAIDPEEAEAVVSRTQHELPSFSLFTVADVRTQIESGRRHGHTFCEGMIMAGVSGLGVAVPANHARPLLAISLSAIGSRLPAKRIAQVTSEMRQAAGKLASILSAAS